jgi:phosphoenolpyruvate carboxykinase (ATP)
MPPIARLNLDQAIYHFLSGYTSKVGGTEVGLGEEPEITFSTCFGAPFMVHHPTYYADLLRRKIERYGSRCWLINTGWVGGAYGVGKRISISHTRAILNAALSGKLDSVETRLDPVFGFEVPTSCDGVPTDVLDPASAWSSESDYFDKYWELASRFRENFKKFEGESEAAIIDAGPKKR